MVQPNENKNFAREYGNWLKDRVSVRRQNESQVLSTPFLDPFNDGIQMYIDPDGGNLILHDSGSTMDTLLSLGISNTDSTRRQNLIVRALSGSPVELIENRLQVQASPSNFPQRAHFLLTAITRLNDLWMSAVSHSWTDFFEIVAEFLDAQNVLYTANVSLSGKTVEHPIDFVIPMPKKRERLVKLVASPKPNTAKLVSFTWLELMHTRPEAERVVLLNDVRSQDPFSTQSEEQFRDVSDQTVSILQGYSSKVLRWSERNSQSFQALWKADAN